MIYIWQLSEDSSKIPDYSDWTREYLPTPKCECGVKITMGDVDESFHSTYCPMRKHETPKI